MSTEAVLLQPYCNPLTECILHSFGGLVLHVRKHVAVGIQGYGDAGVDGEALILCDYDLRSPRWLFLALSLGR